MLLDGIALLAHSATRPCAWVGRGVESVDMYRGNFDIRDRLEERIALTEFSIDESSCRRADHCCRAAARYRLVLALSEEDGRLVVRPSLLAPIVIAGGPLSVPNRFWFRLPAEPGESVFGGGEQFSHFNLRGRRFPLWTSEQGVGRNKRTRVTWEADVADRAGGDYWWTFFPQPTFASSRHYWLHAECPA